MYIYTLFNSTQRAYRAIDIYTLFKYCSDLGMIFQFSCPHTSSQNGIAQRAIRTINDIRTYLSMHLLLLFEYSHFILPSTLHSPTQKYPIFLLPFFSHKTPTYKYDHLWLPMLSQMTNSTKNLSR